MGEYVISKGPNPNIVAYIEGGDTGRRFFAEKELPYYLNEAEMVWWKDGS